MPGVDMCDLPSPPPFSLHPPYPSSYFSSLHTRTCILFPFFIAFFAKLLSTLFFQFFFHLIFLYSISICYFSSNAHLLSSALHFSLSFFHLSYPLLCFLLTSSLSPSYPFLAIFLTFSPAVHRPFSFLSSFVLPFLLQISFLSSPPLCLLLLALLLILPAPLLHPSLFPLVLMEGGFADFSVFQLKG